MPTIQLVELFGILVNNVIAARVASGDIQPFTVQKERQIKGQGKKFVDVKLKPFEILIAALTDNNRSFGVNIATANGGFLKGTRVSKYLSGDKKAAKYPYLNGTFSFQIRATTDATDKKMLAFAQEIERERASILQAVLNLLNGTHQIGSEIVTGQQILLSGKYFPARVNGQPGDISKGSSLDNVLTKNFAWSSGLKASEITIRDRVAAIIAVLAVTTNTPPAIVPGSGGSGSNKTPASIENLNYVMSNSSGILIAEAKSLLASLARADRAATTDAIITMADRQAVAQSVRGSLGLQAAATGDDVRAGIKAYASTGIQIHNIYSNMANAAGQGGMAVFLTQIWRCLNATSLNSLLKGMSLNKPETVSVSGKKKRGFTYNARAEYVGANIPVNFSSDVFSRAAFDQLMATYIAKGASGVDQLTKEAEKRSKAREASSSKGATGFYGEDHPTIIAYQEEPTDENLRRIVGHVRGGIYSMAALKKIAKNLKIAGQENKLMRGAVEQTILDEVIREYLPRAEKKQGSALAVMTSALGIDNYGGVATDANLIDSALRAVDLKLNAHYGILSESCADSFVAGKTGVLKAADLKMILRNRTKVVGDAVTTAALCQLISESGLDSRSEPLSGKREEKLSTRPPTSGVRSNTRTTQMKINFSGVLGNSSQVNTSPAKIGNPGLLNTLAGAQASAFPPATVQGSAFPPATVQGTAVPAFPTSAGGTRLSPGGTRLSPGGTRSFQTSAGGTQSFFAYPAQQTVNASQFTAL
jgi:hypothetical protein